MFRFYTEQMQLASRENPRRIVRSQLHVVRERKQKRLRLLGRG